MTLRPQSLGRGNVQALREAGWTDEQILLATHIIGYFNYYARLADVLGVEPEQFMRRPAET